MTSLILLGLALWLGIDLLILWAWARLAERR